MRRSGKTMRSYALLLYLLTTGLHAIYADETRPPDMTFVEEEPESHVADKRYLAALAKNGRLPAFALKQNKRLNQAEDQDVEPSFVKELSEKIPDEVWSEDKRHVGAFLKTRGKPHFVKIVGDNLIRYDRSTAFDNDQSSSNSEDESHKENDDSSDWAKNNKRNVATLAKLGRLNSVRYGRYRPQYSSGSKRVNMFDEQLNDEGSNTDTNEVPDSNNDCEEEEEENSSEDNEQDNHTSPNWTLKKRYIAALARSGRLPVWHSQRMWSGGKRDTPGPSWMRNRSGARPYNNKRIGSMDEMRFAKQKNKRCKKSSNADAIESGLQEKKRNLAMLARKGLLPFRPYVPA